MALTTEQLLALQGIFTPLQMVQAQQPPSTSATPQQAAALAVMAAAGAPLGPIQIAQLQSQAQPTVGSPANGAWTVQQLQAMYPTPASWPASWFY